MRAPVIVFAVGALGCIVAHTAILRSVLRSRGTATAEGVPRPRLLVEVVWALVPAVALALLLAVTWPRVRTPVAARRPPGTAVAR